MAGHSHWAGIKHKKAARDKVRGKVFSKYAKLIITCAKAGGVDPTQNFQLRSIIDSAKKENMPNDNIQRCLKKAAGGGDGTDFTAVTYEGYGPGGVAILVEGLTDNKNRTASEVKKAFDQGGGSLGSQGCVGWKFKKRGLITIEKTAINEDELMELVIEAGADDFETVGEIYEILTEVENFQAVRDAIDEKELETDTCTITMLPDDQMDVDVKTGLTVGRLIDRLEDLEDLDDVYTDMNMTEELATAMENA